MYLDIFNRRNERGPKTTTRRRWEPWVAHQHAKTHRHVALTTN